MRMRTAAIGLAAVLACGTAAAEEQFVAKVNGVGIPQAEFDRSWKAFIERSGIPGTHADKGGQLVELRQQVLDQLVDQELLFQDARSRKLLPEPARLDEEVAGVKEGFPTPEAFQEALRGSGLTEAELRGLLERNLSIQGLVEQEIVKTVSVSDVEVREFYAGNQDKFQAPERVRARHILVKVDEGADEKTRAEARAKADALLAKLQAGEDFAELAKSSSDCPSAGQGGDLGFFARGQMVEPFNAAAFALEPGKLSGVVETEYGYHIIRTEEKRPAGAVPEQEVAPKIREYLAARKTQAAVKTRIQELRGAAKIEVLLKL